MHYKATRALIADWYLFLFYILMAESARAYEPRMRRSIPRPMRSTWARWRSSAAREPGGAAAFQQWTAYWPMKQAPTKGACQG